MAVRLQRRRRARRIALTFGAVHAGVCLAGVRAPAAYGLAVAGEGPAARGRLRALALLDAPFALAVAHAAATGAPLGRRLRVGAASDVARAAALGAAFDGAPRSRAVLVAASLAGAATALTIAPHVD